jgi:hypothetical protein
VSRWWRHFKDRNERTVDDIRSVRPNTAVTDVNIDKTEQLLKEDRRILVQELPVSSNLSLERVHHIITVELGVMQVWARWVPCDISDEQKQKHLEVLSTKCYSC